MRSVTPLSRSTHRAIVDAMVIHQRRISNARRLQAVFFFDGAFHRVDVQSARGVRWLEDRAEDLVGVYRRSVSLNQLIEDAQAKLQEEREEVAA